MTGVPSVHVLVDATDQCIPLQLACAPHGSIRCVLHHSRGFLAVTQCCSTAVRGSACRHSITTAAAAGCCTGTSERQANHLCCVSNSKAMGSPQHQAPCLVLPAVLLMLLASLLVSPAAAQTAAPDQGSSVKSASSSNRTKVPPVAIQYPTTPSGSGSASTPPGEASLDAPTTTTTPQLLPGPATPVTARNTSSGQVSAGAPPPAAQGEKSPEIPPPNPAFSPDPQQQEQEQPETVGRGPLPPFDQIVVCAPLTVLVSPRGHSGDTRGAADPNSSSNNGSSTQARPVRVNGEEDVVRAVSWHVVGSTLYISTYGSFAADKLVKVTVYTPGDTLVSVTATGVARVVMAPRWPKLGNLRLSALGVASVVAPGLEVDSLEVVTQG